MSQVLSRQIVRNHLHIYLGELLPEGSAADGPAPRGDVQGDAVRARAQRHQVEKIARKFATLFWDIFLTNLFATITIIHSTSIQERAAMGILKELYPPALFSERLAALIKFSELVRVERGSGQVDAFENTVASAAEHFINLAEKKVEKAIV